MSHPTSRERRKTGVPQNLGFSAYSNIDNGASSQDQERLAELILKATSQWHSGASPKAVRDHGEDSTELLDATKAELDEVSGKILKTLKSLGKVRPCDLAKACGVSQPTAQRRLKELLLDDLIVKNGKTKGVTYALPKT